VVHEFDAMRGYSAGSDEVAIRLNDGTNRLLVKVSNLTAGWGFGVVDSEGKLLAGSRAGNVLWTFPALNLLRCVF
jgi:hypothetical protein